jgi:CDP-diacylglycerol---glycerol-3-phosphate 3-phosphatidyltransferase
VESILGPDRSGILGSCISFRFAGQKLVSDYFAEVVETVGELSYSVTGNDKMTLTPPALLNGSRKDTEEFKKRGNAAIVKMTNSWSSGNEERRQVKSSSHVSVALQIPCFGITQDQQITTRLLKMSLNADYHVAAGYLNLPDIYKPLIKHSVSPFMILTGSPEANGFFTSKGISRYIPHAYL